VNVGRKQINFTSIQVAQNKFATEFVKIENDVEDIEPAYDIPYTTSINIKNEEGESSIVQGSESSNKISYLDS